MRILRWVLLVLVLLVLGLVALPFMLPASVYKEQIIEQARLATGRELKIDGDLHVSFFPTLGVEINKVRFQNVAGASEPDMATMETLVVGAELMPLLSGSLRVTELKLVNPVIHLEINKDGKGNWLFTPANPDAPPPPAGAPPPPPPANAPPPDLSFRDVTLTGGVLTYSDARTGTSQRVDGIDVSVKLPSLDQPMLVKGALTWNKEKITLDAEVAKPRALSSASKSAAKATIDGEVLNATFDGEIDAGEGAAIIGDISFKTKSARRLAAWAGVGLPNVKGFGPMSLTGRMTSTAKRVAFEKAKLSLDGMNGSGNLALESDKPTPKVKGDFTLDRLDLNPYMGGSGGGAGGPRSGAASGWSDARVDFSALRLVDADLDFAVNALSAGGLRIGRSALGIALNGGKLRANLKQLALYGGNGTGTIGLDGSGATPAFALDLNFRGVQAEPFLSDAAGITRLTGTGTLVAKVNGSGSSERAWMRSLNGAARINLADGAIKGVNLAEIARTIQSALTGSAVGGAAKTDFAELSGSFVIKNGVAANKDLKMLNPFVRLNGAGIVDIGNRTLDYRVEPKAVNSIKGQGGKAGLGGIGIPFRIHGPWSNPSYEPDLSGVVNSTLDSLMKGENPLDSLKEGDGGLEGLIPGLGGNKQQDGKKNQKNKKQQNQDIPDPLKGLFGR